MGDKAISEWIDRHLPNKESNDLWDLQAAVLTELSERDSVQYRVRATEQSVMAKVAPLEEETHDSEGC